MKAGWPRSGSPSARIEFHARPSSGCSGWRPPSPQLSRILPGLSRSEVADRLADMTDAQLRARRDRLTDFLDAWGDLVVTDVGAKTSSRLLEFALECPGMALPSEVNARYGEYYRQGPGGRWGLAKYHYEYLDLVRSRRLAYHLHNIGPRPLVPHA